MQTPDLLIMLATRQQIVNYKTIKHYQPKRVVALSSKFAQQNKWCDGLSHLLKGAFWLLPPYDDRLVDVQTLKKKFEVLLKKELSQVTGKIIWAWGGAQKPHSTALYLLAQEYIQSEPQRHVLVYAEGNHNIFFEDGNPEPVEMKATLTAEEIITVHGLRVLSNPAKQEDVSTPEALHSFLNDQKSREDEWRLPPFQEEFERLASQPAVYRKDLINLVTQSLPKDLLQSLHNNMLASAEEQNCHNNPHVAPFLRALANACDAKVTNALFTSAAHKLDLRQIKQEDSGIMPSGLAFEKHARARMLQWYEARGIPMGLVATMSLDVDVEGISMQGVYASRDPESQAQYDCILVTPQGRFIAIDFKSAGKRNYRAQQASVTFAGGTHANLYYLYPWIEEDLPGSPAIGDKRSKTIKNRMNSIMQMDKTLRMENKAPTDWRGIRFYKKDNDFFEDLEKVLALKAL